MVIENELTAKAAAKSVDVAFNLVSSLVNDKPTRLSKLFFAFAPESAVGWVINRRLRLTQIKLQEDLFNLCCKSLLDDYVKASKKYARSAKDAKNPALIGMLEQMEGDLRLLATIKRSLALLPDVASEDGKPAHADERELSWWSTFEDFAKRPNEDWRADLLAKAVVANEMEPGAIRLKALWEIGMLEADDFGMLAFFCDSAVHIDGKPLVLLDPEEQNTFVMGLDDGRSGNLAYIIADLVDRRLVQKALTQFDTTEPVILGHNLGPHRLHHTPTNSKDGQESAIQIAAFGPTDYALDICRLYDAHFNIASDANFESFKRSLEEASVTNEDFGSVKFSRD